MHIDVKVTCWKRVKLPEEMTKEEAITILEREKSIDYFFDEEETLKEKYPNHEFTYEDIENSEEDMTTKENSDNPTLELQDDDDDEIWDNYNGKA